MSALLAAVVALASPPVAVTVETADVRVAAGETTEARVTVRIRPGFHVQANPAAEEFLVPLTVELQERPPVRVGLPVYPAGRPHRLRGAASDLLTYAGTVTVRVPVSVESDVERGRDEVVALSGSLHYQACSGRVCLRPSTTPFRLVVHVSGIVRCNSLLGGGFTSWAALLPPGGYGLCSYGLCGGALGMSPKGPDEASRNTHSDCFPHLTECSVYGGISEYEPGSRVFSREPAYRTIIVPEITTTRSTDGCLCGGGA
jgi:hypothetical protein